MVENKGASTLVAVFIILVVSLIAVSWFRASTISGSGVQTEIIQQSEINTFNHRFENTKLYLENSMFYAGQKGSDKAANFSGRREKDQEARYWLCQENKQIPSKIEVRNATSNKTLEFMQERFEELHGIRDNTVYRVGEATCMDTGYNNMPADEASDNFTQAVEINSINLSKENGDLSKTREDITLSKDIKYNRIWYIYSTLKKWINQEDLKNKVRDNVEQVKDSGMRVKDICINDGSQCTYKDPTMCSDHGQSIDAAVYEGLSEEADKLQSSEEYFNSTNIECGFSPNTKSNVPYPGNSVAVRDSKIPENTSTGPSDFCGCNEWNTSAQEVCLDKKWDYKCKRPWYLEIESKIDTTLTCTDTKFNNIPGNKTLENLEWKIDLSFKVSETNPNQGSSYSCSQQPYSTLPGSFRSCAYSGTASTCETEVKTVE